MARNREFDDALDELKMLHDAKNHDYATAENPYKNLEGCERLGIEAWRGIVVRLMDKFERVEQYCVNGELAIKSEGMEDTFKDIAVYSTLAMILFRRDQEKQQELTELERGKGDWEPPTYPARPEWDLPKLEPRPSLFPEDEHGNSDESFTNPIIGMREAAEKQQEEEHRRADEDSAHIKSLMERDKLSDIEKLEVQRRMNQLNNYREDEAKKNEAFLRDPKKQEAERRARDN
jgi:hypothetical protein